MRRGDARGGIYGARLGCYNRPAAVQFGMLVRGAPVWQGRRG